MGPDLRPRRATGLMPPPERIRGYRDVIDGPHLLHRFVPELE